MLLVLYFERASRRRALGAGCVGGTPSAWPGHHLCAAPARLPLSWGLRMLRCPFAVAFGSSHLHPCGAAAPAASLPVTGRPAPAVPCPRQWRQPWLPSGFQDILPQRSQRYLGRVRHFGGFPSWSSLYMYIFCAPGQVICFSNLRK